MRLLKGFLFAICGLFLVITIMSLFIPSKVMTVRSVVINAPVEKIMEQVRDFNNWKNWHPVFESNKNIIISNDGKKTAEWASGPNKNKLIITEETPLMIKVLLERPGENPVENIIALVTTENRSSPDVEWRSLTRLKWYPWEKFAGMFVDKITGPGYEQALNNMKAYVESH